MRGKTGYYMRFCKVKTCRKIYRTTAQYSQKCDGCKQSTGCGAKKIKNEVYFKRK